MGFHSSLCIFAASIIGFTVFGNAQKQAVFDCENRQMNVVFVLDGSGSVTEPNFDISKDIISSVAGNFDMDEKATWLAMEQFSTDQTFEIAFSSDNSDFNSQLSQVPYRGGGTYTNDALIFVKDVILPSLPNNRRHLDNAIVVMTDGQSQGTPPKEAADDLRATEGSFVFSVGLGGDQNLTELISIANDGDLFFVFNSPWPYYTDPLQLQIIAEDMATRICTASSCTCENGVPATGDDCPSEAAFDFCLECDLGYDLSSDNICIYDETLPNIKTETFVSNIVAVQPWYSDYENSTSARFKDLEKKLGETYYRALGTNFGSLILNKVTQTMVSDRLRTDQEALMCDFTIDVIGYETDNLAEIFNVKVEENETVFEYMNYETPAKIGVPCDANDCEETDTCINSADNTQFECIPEPTPEPSSSTRTDIGFLLALCSGFLMIRGRNGL